MKQRIIKFRAWDKKNKDWAHIDIDDWSGSVGPVATITYDPNRLELSSDERYEWMQFTGLTDKNSTEIYESDVLQEEKSGQTQPVIFKDGVFVVDIGELFEGVSHRYAPLNGWANHSKVIGNIYGIEEIETMTLTVREAA